MKFQKVREAIDDLNLEDPRSVLFEGKNSPHEWVYSQRMMRWLGILRPDANELLKIAAYGQHLARWKIPRSDFPIGKAGYYQWRNSLKKFHAEQVGDIMRDCDYDSASVLQVKDLLSKKNLGSDIDSASLEDAACLVFLEDQFEGFVAKHSEEKLMVIVRKTWAKMSEKAQKHALELKFTDREKHVIESALGAL